MRNLFAKNAGNREQFASAHMMGEGRVFLAGKDFLKDQIRQARGIVGIDENDLRVDIEIRRHFRQ